MKVVFTPRSRRELGEIAEYIERDNPLAAERTVIDIRARCLKLADHPNRGAEIAIRNGVVIRRLVEGHYLIVYSVKANEVRIHRITHGARSPRILLKNLDLP
jgi:toxin ParE1/3/4